MCVMSVISGYGQSLPNAFWNRQTWPPFRDLLEQARKVDQELKQPDCIEPEKDEWMKRIEERILDLELEVLRAAQKRV